MGRSGFHPISAVLALLPFDHIAFDFIGLLSETAEGYKYMLIIVDVVTQFIILRPLKMKLSKEVACKDGHKQIPSRRICELGKDASCNPNVSK